MAASEIRAVYRLTYVGDGEREVVSGLRTGLPADIHGVEFTLEQVNDTTLLVCSAQAQIRRRHALTTVKGRASLPFDDGRLEFERLA